jgi:hypothetical protein
MPFSPAVRELFNSGKHGDLLARLEASHQHLIERRKNAVEFPCPDELRQRTASNCLVLQQVQLHRAERLVAGTGTMLLEANVYGLALAVRGHYEATAVLGYVCDRLNSLKAKNIKFDDFAHQIACLVLGARHSQFPKAPNSPNILSCIEKADRYLDTHLLKEQKGMLRDGYDWLSQFAHPNFCGNSTACTIEKETSRFVFRHGGEIRDIDFDLIRHLAISAGLFIYLFDRLTVEISDFR